MEYTTIDAPLITNPWNDPNYYIVVRPNNIPMIVLLILSMIALSIVPIIIWRTKHKERTTISWLLAGAGFYISFYLLQRVTDYLFFALNSPVSRFFNESAIARNLYYIIMTGVSLGFGMFIVMNFVLKKNRMRENAVFFGFGYIGAGYIFGLYWPISLLISAIAGKNTSFSYGRLSFIGETESAVLKFLNSILTSYNFTSVIEIISSILTIILYVGLAVIVYYGIVNANKKWIVASVVLSVLPEVLKTLTSKLGLVWFAFLLYTVPLTIAVAVIAKKLYRNLNAGEEKADQLQGADNKS